MNPGISAVTRCAESFLIVWNAEKTAQGMRFIPYTGSLLVNLGQLALHFWFECQYDSTSISISLTNENNYSSLQRGGIYYQVKVVILDVKERPKHEQVNKLPINVRTKYKIWNLETNVFKKDFDNLQLNYPLSFCVTITDHIAIISDRYQLNDKSIQTSRQKDDVPCLDSLSADLWKLLANGAEHDVMVNSGSWQFPAHKTVLSSRSDVFSALFKSGITKTKNGVVVIEDGAPPLDMEHFLKYLYSGKVDDLTEESAIRLYEIADKYGVDALMKRCSDFLVEVLTPENACKFLLLADAHNDRDFKVSAKSFIIQREDIMRSREWSRISAHHPQLGVEVFKAHLQARTKEQRL